MIKTNAANFKHGDVLLGIPIAARGLDKAFGEGYWIGVVYNSPYHGQLSLSWNWTSGTSAAKGIKTMIIASALVSGHVVIGNVANLLDQKSEGL